MISFCIPFRTDNSYREISFQFVTQTLKKEWPDDEVIVADSGHEPFSRSASRNKAADESTGGILVFLDADSYVPLWQLRQAVGLAWAPNQNWCFPYDLYYSLTAPGSMKFMTGLEVDDRDSVYVFPDPVDSFDRPASVGGCVVVSRFAFETVRGYDERFIGWAFEDRAFAYSLEVYFGLVARVPGPLYHLWHPDVETDKFNHPHMRANQALCNRYAEASKNEFEMRKLIKERY